MVPRLITIPVSHYCEKARWALERSGLAYQEDAHLPFFQILPVKRAGGKRSVPVLATDDGAITDSTAILQWVDARVATPWLYPAAISGEVLALEERFDEALGPATRRVAFHHILADRKLALSAGLDGVPRFERSVLPLIFPIARLMLTRFYRIKPDAVAADLATIRQLFAEVGERLGGGRYLVGDRLTAADISFAALAAPLLFPVGYGATLPRVEDLPPALRALVDELRALPAGKYGLRLYAEDRPRRNAPAAAA